MLMGNWPAWHDLSCKTSTQYRKSPWKNILPYRRIEPATVWIPDRCSSDQANGPSWRVSIFFTVGVGNSSCSKYECTDQLEDFLYLLVRDFQHVLFELMPDWHSEDSIPTVAINCRKDYKRVWKVTLVFWATLRTVLLLCVKFHICL